LVANIDIARKSASVLWVKDRNNTPDDFIMQFLPLKIHFKYLNQIDFTQDLSQTGIMLIFQISLFLL